MIWIFILAGIFSGIAKDIGAIDATVNLALSVVPPRMLLDYQESDRECQRQEGSPVLHRNPCVPCKSVHRKQHHCNYNHRKLCK